MDRRCSARWKRSSNAEVSGSLRQSSRDQQQADRRGGSKDGHVQIHSQWQQRQQDSHRQRAGVRPRFLAAHVAIEIPAVAILRLGIAQLQAQVSVRADAGLLLFGVVLVDEASGGGPRNTQTTHALPRVQSRHDARDHYHRRHGESDLQQTST